MSSAGKPHKVCKSRAFQSRLKYYGIGSRQNGDASIFDTRVPSIGDVEKCFGNIEDTQSFGRIQQGHTGKPRTEEKESHAWV